MKRNHILSKTWSYRKNSGGKSEPNDIDDMKGESHAGNNTVGLVANQTASNDFFPTQTSGEKLNSINLTNEEEYVCQSEKNYNDALDKLRSYECRALNLFR